MTQRVVALLGVSGVGKTTFLQKLSDKIEFQHLSAGSLIALGRAQSQVGRDNLRLLDVNENQNFLARGFIRARDPRVKNIVMDGHAIIHGSNSTVEITKEVFAAIGTSLIVHLEADPAEILQNRVRDESRARPLLSIGQLEDHQQRSRRQAATIAYELGIDIVDITHSNYKDLLQRLCDHYV